MIHLVTDSTSDLTPERAAELGVRVVPLYVRFGEEQFRDNVELSADEFYRRLQQPGQPHPSTSQPAPEDFASVYRELLAAPGDQVVSVHLPAALSGTAQSAMLAAQEFGGSVHVIDGHTVSAGLQLLLAAARRLADQGASVEEVVSGIEQRVAQVCVYVLIDTLTYLQRGGRIGRAQALVGGVLNFKPVLEVGTEVMPRTRVRSRSKGIDALLSLLGEQAGYEELCVMFTDDRGFGEQLRARIGEQYSGVPCGFGQLGPVLGTYSGPGALGVAGLRRA